MTALGRWLVGILNAHIERHNVPVAEPAPAPVDDAPALWAVWEENARRIFWGEQAVRATSRPCPICGCHAAMIDHWCDVRAGVIPRPITLLNADGSAT